MSPEFDLRHVSFEGVPVPARRGRVSHAVPRHAPDRGCLNDNGRETPAGRSDSQAIDFARWVLGQASLEASAYRPDCLRRRVPACLRTLKARSEDEARQAIARHPDSLQPALSSLLIGVTAFFRDREVFEDLRTVVVPALAERRGALRVWSAGCASGAEMYSVAMLLADAGLLARAQLLGTDCRHAAVVRACSASWPIEEARAAGSDAFTRYFEPTADGRWRPIAELRRAVQWKVADVLSAVEPGPWDVILWRNTAIYLNPADAAATCRNLAARLAPGGFLVLGKAEHPPRGADLAVLSRCIYRNRGA